jgi:hypothetical protein
VAQGVDVLDLLHSEYIEIHARDALGDQPALGGQLPLHELAEVGAQLEAARIIEREPRRLLDLALDALAVETSARKSKREKRLFRLNVPTATCTSAPGGEDAGLNAPHSPGRSQDAWCRVVAHERGLLAVGDPRRVRR